MNKSKKVDSFNKATSILALSILLGTITYAWTGPTQSAPNGNVPAPINVGSILQEKIGGIRILGDSFIGTSSSPYSSFTIHGKGYSESTLSGDGGHTLATKDYVDSKVVAGGGNSSAYCAYTGQTHTVNLAINHYMNLVANCTVTVDDTGYQTFSFSASGAGGSCSRTGNNQDSHPNCTYAGQWSNGDYQTVEVGGDFNRTTGVLTCHLAEVGGQSTSNTYTFTKDESKCSGGSGSVTETDPTVAESVKDGVSWSEVTGKPTINSVPSGSVFIMTSCPSGWSSVGNWGTIQDQTGIGGIQVYQCQAP